MRKTLIKVLFTLLLFGIYIPHLSFGETTEVLTEKYIITYNNNDDSSDVLISDGELYVNLSLVHSLLGFDVKFVDHSISIDDKSSKLIIQYDNGDLYEGDTLNSKRNGDGVLHIQSGGRYDGEWKNDMYEGNGTLVYPNGDIYIGQFSKGFPHGEGKFIYTNGDTYNGDVVYGLREGFGRYYENPKNKYTGYWKNGLRNGKGKALVDERPRRGLWENNVFIKTLIEAEFNF